MGSYRRAWEQSPAAIATSRRGVRPIRLRLARQLGAPDRENPGNDPPRCKKLAVTINGRLHGATHSPGLDGATHSPAPRIWMIGCVHPLSGTKDVDGPFRPPRCARHWRCWSLRHSLTIQHVSGFIALGPIPGMGRGGVLPPSPVLAPESALGSRPRVALSSAQVSSV